MVIAQLGWVDCPAIAQLVERRTVDVSVILRSVVRIRLAGPEFSYIPMCVSLCVSESMDTRGGQFHDNQSTDATHLTVLPRTRSLSTLFFVSSVAWFHIRIALTHSLTCIRPHGLTNHSCCLSESCNSDRIGALREPIFSTSEISIHPHYPQTDQYDQPDY